MGWLDDVRAEKNSFVRGLTFVLGGAALILAGTLVGLGEGKLIQIGAGTLAVTGVVVAFLGVFIYVVPPLLPSK